MNGFEKAQEVEISAWRDLEPFLRARCYEGRFVITQKGNLSEFLQKSVGDLLFNSDAQTVWSIELKCEQKKTGNFFLETWSNRRRFTPGWMFTLNCDFLFCYFMDAGELYSIRFAALRRWAFVDPGKFTDGGRIWEYPEKRQRKYEQLNDTWGRCVPIEIIARDVGLNKFQIKDQL